MKNIIKLLKNNAKKKKFCLNINISLFIFYFNKH